MTTWQRGREILGKRMQEKTVALKMLLADLAAEPPLRVPGTAVFLYGTTDGTPPALVHNLTHNKVRSEEHTSELQSHSDLVCRLLLEKKKLINPARLF